MDEVPTELDIMGAEDVDWNDIFEIVELKVSPEAVSRVGVELDRCWLRVGVKELTTEVFGAGRVLHCWDEEVFAEFLLSIGPLIFVVAIQVCSRRRGQEDW